MSCPALPRSRAGHRASHPCALSTLAGVPEALPLPFSIPNPFSPNFTSLLCYSRCHLAFACSVACRLPLSGPSRHQQPAVSRLQFPRPPRPSSAALGKPLIAGTRHSTLDYCAPILRPLWPPLFLGPFGPKSAQICVRRMMD